MNLQIKHYERNLQGKDYVVGDIHGSFRDLMQILLKMNFDFEKDRLFSVGDLCDRGMFSEDVLKWMNYDWFFPVFGNHEALLMGYVEKLINYEAIIKIGGEWWFEINEQEQEKIMEYFNLLPIAIEVETSHGKIGIIHATCPMDSWNDFKLKLEEDDAYKYINKAIWTYCKNREQHKVNDIESIIVGHTTLENMLQIENVFFIDTGATFTRGFFTILELETMKPVEHLNMDLV